jgi:uncharacterized membrane protein YeaQ/YmgE (transglycosylase-associated protein family)
MGAHSLIAWLVIGVVAGWLAGRLMKGGFGLLGDVVVGVIGALVGGWLARQAGVHVGNGLIASIVTATVGAMVLIFLLRLVKQA